MRNGHKEFIFVILEQLHISKRDLRITLIIRRDEKEVLFTHHDRVQTIFMRKMKIRNAVQM